MSEHRVGIHWTADGDFAAGRYSRVHEWRFDGGAVVRASASPHVVPVPFADPARVDPEEAFVAAVASCHMLWFLDFAKRAGHIVASYSDDAVGTMANGEDGRVWIPRVDLHPRVEWTGREPDAAELDQLHHRAHDACFIANSVRTEIVTNIA